jgi:hypothetical protein
LFVATWFATSNGFSDSWLIGNGFTNHMTNNRKLCKQLDKTVNSKEKIRNGEYILVKGEKKKKKVWNVVQWSRRVKYS